MTNLHNCQMRRLYNYASSVGKIACLSSFLWKGRTNCVEVGNVKGDASEENERLILGAMIW